jgi:hypothetical protein
MRPRAMNSASMAPAVRPRRNVPPMARRPIGALPWRAAVQVYHHKRVRRIARHPGCDRHGGRRCPPGRRNNHGHRLSRIQDAVADGHQRTRRSGPGSRCCIFCRPAYRRVKRHCRGAASCQARRQCPGPTAKRCRSGFHQRAAAFTERPEGLIGWNGGNQLQHVIGSRTFRR